MAVDPRNDSPGLSSRQVRGSGAPGEPDPRTSARPMVSTAPESGGQRHDVAEQLAQAGAGERRTEGPFAGEGVRAEGGTGEVQAAEQVTLDRVVGAVGRG